MKIRLEGTKEEIKWAIQSLNEVYSVTDKSKLYANRNGGEYRCYLDVVPFFIRSGSIANNAQNSEPQPKFWDVVLGVSDE